MAIIKKKKKKTENNWRDEGGENSVPSYTTGVYVMVQLLYKIAC